MNKYQNTRPNPISFSLVIELDLSKKSNLIINTRYDFKLRFCLERI